MKPERATSFLGKSSQGFIALQLQNPISMLHVASISRGALEPAQLVLQYKSCCRALLCPLFTFFPGIGVN